MQERCIDTKSGKVFYWISDVWTKDKRTLFFLHGMTGDHTMFEKQVDFFVKDYNILLWDAPAHGKSRPFQQFNYDKAAKAIKQLFVAENISDAVFVGQSMGGFLTQAVIKRFPEIVMAFVSIDSTPYGEEYYSKSDVFWLKQVEWMASLFSLKTIKHAIAKQNTATQAGYDNMISMLVPYGKKEICHLMGIGYAGFLEDNCELKIECPMLLLVGERDNTGKVKQYNKAWSRRTGSDIIWIPNAAHNSNVDNPESVNVCIKEFLEKLN